MESDMGRVRSATADRFGCGTAGGYTGMFKFVSVNKYVVFYCVPTLAGWPVKGETRRYWSCYYYHCHLLRLHSDMISANGQ